METSLAGCCQLPVYNPYSLGILTEWKHLWQTARRLQLLADPYSLGILTEWKRVVSL